MDKQLIYNSQLEQVRRILQEPNPPGWKASGLSRDFYLDIMERIVRSAAKWVNEDGAVIDPVLHEEHHQSSPRFASPCAVLLRFGRCQDLKEKLYLVMDHCCNTLKSQDSIMFSPDFWMRELSTAFHCLEGSAPEERLAKWKESLAQVVPEKNYKVVSPDPAMRRSFHNWAIYSAAGECMREHYGLPGPDGCLWGQHFFDAYVRQQLWRFNEYGMYQDPKDPITYDITTRLQLEAAFEAGYDGAWKEGLRQVLDDAMLATLLFMPPSGQVPFGGRSSQFYFQEGIICALCELAAKRHKATEPRLAAAFKRQAHLSALAVRPGLLREDGRLFHIKNYFPQESRHGCDTYGHYAVYLLFASSVFALAALYADDSIEEAPAVSELGGFAFGLRYNFHKLFLNANGNYLEYDLKPNPEHDACGLGRILMKDLPWGLLPVLPFAQKKSYCVASGLPENLSPASIAPEWDDEAGNVCRLAEAQCDACDFRQLGDGVWELKYQLGKTEVIYVADLTKSGRIALEVSVSGNAFNPRMVVPVLHFDGEHTPETTLRGNGFSCTMDGRKLELFSDGAPAVINGTAVNRTGLYDLVNIPFLDSRLKMSMKVE
ncbi:MAG: hypothetical protein IKS20_08625 [Victivallales bacterium]|nr:hypothetical protein [Victivallales bacterium]